MLAFASARIASRAIIPGAGQFAVKFAQVAHVAVLGECDVEHGGH